MAIATVTATPYLHPVRQDIHSNYVGGKIDLSTRTLSDIIFFAKVPNGAVITDIYMVPRHGDTARTMKLGITGGSAASETAFGTLTLTTATRMVVSGLPFKVSISDTDAQAGAVVYGTIATGTWTTSGSIEFGVTYRFDVTT